MAEPEANDERSKVERWRFAVCLRLGVPPDHAVAFAEGDGDLHELENLIGRGCEPVLAVQIA